MGMNPRNSAHFAILALVASLSFGCSRAEPPSHASANAAAAPPAAGALAASAPVAGALPKAGLSLIVTVDMSLRVTDLPATTAKVRREVEAAGGYVGSSNARSGDEEGATIDLRVPADRTAALRSTLRAMGDVTSESETVEDVTEQRADLGARLHNARTQEARLLEIMQQKTGSIPDVLEAERELSRVRETVERLEAEQRAMDGKVNLATIHLSMTTPSAAAWQTPGRSISRSWSAGVKGAQAMSVYGAMAVATVAPTLIPVLSALLLVVMLYRRSRARKQNERMATAAP